MVVSAVGINPASYFNKTHQYSYNPVAFGRRNSNFNDNFVKPEAEVLKIPETNVKIPKAKFSIFQGNGKIATLARGVFAGATIGAAVSAPISCSPPTDIYSPPPSPTPTSGSVTPTATPTVTPIPGTSLEESTKAIYYDTLGLRPTESKSGGTRGTGVPNFEYNSTDSRYNIRIDAKINPVESTPEKYVLEGTYITDGMSSLEFYREEQTPLGDGRIGYKQKITDPPLKYSSIYEKIGDEIKVYNVQDGTTIEQLNKILTRGINQNEIRVRGPLGSELSTIKYDKFIFEVASQYVSKFVSKSASKCLEFLRRAAA